MADNFVVAPTPMIAPVMVWVVETGMPPSVDSKIDAAAAVSAALHFGSIRIDGFKAPFSQTNARGRFHQRESPR